MYRFKRPMIAAALVAAVALAGCASVEGFLDKNSLAAELVVQQATARAIQAGKTPAEQQARAAKIVAIATQAKATFDTTAADLPSIVALVGQRVLELKLSPADALLAQDLIQVLAQEIQSKVCPATPGAATTAGVCTIPANLTVYVDTVIGWVISTAQVYVPATS